MKQKIIEFYKKHKRKIIAIAVIIFLLKECISIPGAKEALESLRAYSKPMMYSNVNELWPLKCKISDELVEKDLIYVVVEHFEDRTGWRDSFPSWDMQMANGVRLYTGVLGFGKLKEVYPYFRFNDSLRKPNLIFKTNISDLSIEQGVRKKLLKRFGGNDDEGRQHFCDVYYGTHYKTVRMTLNLTVLNEDCIIGQRTRTIKQTYAGASGFIHEGEKGIVPRAYHNKSAPRLRRTDEDVVMKTMHHAISESMEAYYSIVLRPIYKRKLHLKLVKPHDDGRKPTKPIFNF